MMSAFPPKQTCAAQLRCPAWANSGHLTLQTERQPGGKRAQKTQTQPSRAALIFAIVASTDHAAALGRRAYRFFGKRIFENRSISMVDLQATHLPLRTKIFQAAKPASCSIVTSNLIGLRPRLCSS